MAEIVTNRDLYRLVTELAGRHRSSELSLERYLVGLRQLASAYRGRSSIAATELLGLLGAGFEGDAATAQTPSGGVEDEGHAAWQARIDAQILDLQQMRETGLLDLEHRYFGVDAPSGARWYNFDPASFLECAMAGSFGGWEEGDDTGRQYVPGLVTTLDESGASRNVDPRELVQSPTPMPPLTWEHLTDLLWAGQCYE